jgi:transposase
MEKYIVTLEPSERQELQAIISKGTHAAAKISNALILLNCDVCANPEQRRTSEDIAQVLHISARKIDRIKRRFVEEGFDIALGRKASTRQYERKIDGDIEAHLIALSCSQPPSGRSHWTLRLLADKVVELEYIDAISYETVRRALKKTNSSLGKR